MSRRSVGRITVLVGAALAMSSCGLVGDDGTYEVVAEFPRAVALYESGAVQVLGLPAGEVTDVEVDGELVRVTMAVDDDVPLPADVRAAIVPQSLIGERRVQLFPPFRSGDRLAGDGHVIRVDDTVVPVEPDEALEALQEFLDALDADGVGRLVDNAAGALDGQGEALGGALRDLSDLVATVEENDDAIVEIAERFDDFTTTLLSREGQLAEVLDDFSVAADVLADERADIEALVSGLASASENGLDLVSEHALRLRTDVQILERLTSSIDANLASVDQVFEGAAATVEGLLPAFNQELSALNLRTSLSPLLGEALGPVFDSVGVPFPCVPVDVVCPDGPVRGTRAPVAQRFTPERGADDESGTDRSPGRGPADPGTGRRADGDRGVLDSFLRTLFGVAS